MVLAQCWATAGLADAQYWLDNSTTYYGCSVNVFSWPGFMSVIEYFTLC